MGSDPHQRRDCFISCLGANGSSAFDKQGTQRRVLPVISSSFEGHCDLSKNMLPASEGIESQEEFIYLMAELSLRVIRTTQSHILSIRSKK